MQRGSFKPILVQALIILIAILAAFWIWTQPYETRPQLLNLFLCLGGAALISRGVLSAETPTMQLLRLYDESPYDNTSIGEREASALIARLYRSFAIVAVGVLLFNIALSGRGI